jgi:hypothetical protein
MRKDFLIQYMRKCANIEPYMRRTLVIYDFATHLFLISYYVYEENLFSFLSVLHIQGTPLGTPKHACGGWERLFALLIVVAKY